MPLAIQKEGQESLLFANGLSDLAENLVDTVDFSGAELVSVCGALLQSVLFLSHNNCVISQTNCPIFTKLGIRDPLTIPNVLCKFRGGGLFRSCFIAVRVVWCALSSITQKRLGVGSRNLVKSCRKLC